MPKRPVALLVFCMGIMSMALSAAVYAAPAAPSTPASKSTPITAPAPTASASSIDSVSLRRDDAPASSGAEEKSTIASMDGPRVAIALAAVIALILLLRAGARRFFDLPGGQRSTSAVQIISRTVLAPRQHVVLLQVGKRVIVVGDSGGQMSPLCQIDDPDEVAQLVGHIREEKLSASVKSFGSLFRRAKDDIEEDAPAEPGPTTPISDRFTEEPAEDPELLSTREELKGLMQKVRLVSEQFHTG